MGYISIKKQRKNGVSPSTAYRSYAWKTAYPVSYALAEFGQYPKIQVSQKMQGENKIFFETL